MMPSFEAVNYSLRPSKTIQRHLVFEGIQQLQGVLGRFQLYVGFGSIWFTDFVMAHKVLSIDDMVSIESDEIGYCRAVFNSPYATVRVCRGASSVVLPNLYDNVAFNGRPWIVWLDYDGEFDEAKRDDVRSVIENAPVNSVLLVTFDGNERRYGTVAERPELFKRLFGPVVPDDLSKDACRDARMQETLANFAIDLMKSIANDLARPGAFIPAFRLIYRDTATMVTVGGLLPSLGAVRPALGVIDDANWLCQPEKPIIAPHLTIREAVTLQSQLPCAEPLTRASVQKLGFDLAEDQIAGFAKYYRHYPAFAQIVA